MPPGIDWGSSLTRKRERLPSSLRDATSLWEGGFFLRRQTKSFQLRLFGEKQAGRFDFLCVFM